MEKNVEGWKKQLRERTQLPDNVPSEIYVWGTGLLGKFAIHQFSNAGTKVKGVLTSPGYGECDSVEGIPVVNLEAVKNTDIIVICSISYPAIEDYLTSMRYKNYFYYELFPCLYPAIKAYFMWGDDIWNRLIQNDGKIGQLHKLLQHDSVSTLILNNLISYRTTFDEQYIDRAYNISTVRGTQYFDREIVNFGQDEVFVDCGASVGYISEDFIRLTHNEYKDIYLFEADPEVCSVAQNLLKNYKNVHFLPVGVGEKDEFLYFNSNPEHPTYGAVSEYGDKKVHIVRLDDALEKCTPTMITMDIEGSEMAALRGAEKLIRRCRPKMSISVYHKFEDLFEIPLWLNELDLNYKFYLRHYTRAYCDSVLICIPQ